MELQEFKELIASQREGFFHGSPHDKAQVSFNLLCAVAQRLVVIEEKLDTVTAVTF